MVMKTIQIHTGRRRAQRLYREICSCEKCGKAAMDRHHVDGNTLNNDPANIEFLCRRCHMESDGRLISFSEQAKARINSTTEAAAIARRSRSHCKRGHLLSGVNLYIKPSGSRICITCRNLQRKGQLND